MDSKLDNLVIALPLAPSNAEIRVMLEPEVDSKAFNLVIALPEAVFNEPVVDSIEAVIAFNELMFDVDDVTDERSIPLYVNEPVNMGLCIIILLSL